jgi:simple sugar transport system ATP-binding protein
MPKKQKPLLEARNITKRFGDFTANDRIGFTINKGSIHALLGENGAGKSTFVKMLYGVQPPDDGRFIWDGEEVKITSPKAARAMGIAMVFQHFSLFPALTVAENIALALDDAPPIASLSKRIIEASERWGFSIEPYRPVGDLSVGEQQRVEVIRCLLQNPKLLIMDEPTSVLTPQETENLFDVLRRLAKDGCAVLYISHKLDEIMALTEKATILRSGVNVGDVVPKKSSTRKMAEMMVGSSVDWVERKEHITGAGQKTVFSLKALSRPAETAFSTPLQSVSLDVRAGEILGIAGISGNGQRELTEALTGEWRSPDAAMITFGGEPIGRLSPKGRRRLGIEMVPEERNGHAAVPDMTLVENTFLTHFDRMRGGNSILGRMLTHAGRGVDVTMRIIKDHDVRTPHGNPEARQLSGGNLQKFIMGRMLVTKPRMAIIAQPTWGVDVGAGTAIKRSLLSLAEEGCGIILISQDLEEIFSLSDRIAVLNQGRLTEAFPATSLTAEDVGLLMGGTHEDPEKKTAGAV